MTVTSLPQPGPDAQTASAQQAGSAEPAPAGRLLDPAALLLLVVGLATRLYQLDMPRAVVFDEMHYGKYAAYYLKNLFFFDSQPPLGKQLLAFGTYLAGFDGEFVFDRIGTPYPDSVPILRMRLLPAVVGSLLLPATYHLLRELGVSRRAAVLAGILMLLENALLTQSRFLFLEPFLLLFSVLGLLGLARGRRCGGRLSLAALGWMVLGFGFLGAATAVRYSGLMPLLLGCVIVYRDFWTLVPRRDVSGRQLAAQLTVRCLVMVAVPTAVYLGSFYAHLSVLYKAGSGHEGVMTSAFQASLEDGLANIVKNQPLLVGHGSQVTLRHALGRPCWLHSHDTPYPAVYDHDDEDRNSSSQQQVSCFSGKDVNNWWIVKDPDTKDLRVQTPFQPFKHGDIVQLVHGLTGNHLNSNEFKAPLSSSEQEVSCYTKVNASLPVQDLWMVQLVNPKETDGVWHAISSQVRFVHTNDGLALKYSGRKLPKWGHSQQEVVCDKVINQDDTIWNVEEHRYGQAESSAETERQMDLLASDLIPVTAMDLSFWRKFYELQLKMLFNNQEVVQGHTYASDPFEWLTMARGVAYWISPHSNAQIHLLGNAAVWAAASGALCLYAGLALVYLLRRRRGCYDIPDAEWTKMCTICQTILAGFAFNYVPYFVIDHTFFLHHYMLAYIFAVMITACAVDHLYFIADHLGWRPLRHLLTLCLLAWLAACVYTFAEFSVLSYGTTALSAGDVRSLSWRTSWDLIVHKK
ncbi:protein O-mannosyltransferase 1-like [Pollicipes pollicipes]|uniref:protein O-mannosyltransferase 1-like n=1 Tax=Pollicipes pollicipes TaxID=41117 RepID=UPI0018857192|nr:protein O-mannosyltransferase 1-like [Pollicipes pollicipes]